MTTQTPVYDSRPTRRLALALFTALFALTAIGSSSAQEIGGRTQNDKALLAAPDHDAEVLRNENEQQADILKLKKQLAEARHESLVAKREEMRAREMAVEVKARLSEQLEQLTAKAQQLELIQREQSRDLPPIKDGRFVVFRLNNLPAESVADTVQKVLGTQSVRLAVDDDNNQLIVFGTEATLTVVQKLIEQLGEQTVASKASEAASSAPAQAGRVPRSLLVRIFWLADGVPADKGQDPGAFLPESVLDATERLGLTRPRLVTQTVNSLAVKSDEPIAFATSVPAIVGDIPVGLNCEGRVKLLPENRVDVEMEIDVEGPIRCSLSGSLASPLGHYMVLGTANSLVPQKPAADDSAKMDEGGMEMEMEMGRGGYGGEGGYRAGRPMGRMGMEGGGYGMGRGEGGFGMAAAPSADAKYNTSRFAFVVQVIEGQSYPADANTSSAESGDEEPVGIRPNKATPPENDLFDF